MNGRTRLSAAGCEELEIGVWGIAADKICRGACRCRQRFFEGWL